MQAVRPSAGEAGVESEPMAASRGKKQTNSGQVPVDQIRSLVQLMKDYELEEIYWQDGDRRIRLRGKGSAALPPPASYGMPVPYVAQPPFVQPQPAPVQADAAAPAPSSDAAPESAETETNKYVEIKSPMVGTFYAAPAPDKPPFVDIGSHVEPDTIVCLIEAMKVFNEIPAEVSGTIVKVLVENGQPVEYGQPLFLVDPTG